MPIAFGSLIGKTVVGSSRTIARALIPPLVRRGWTATRIINQLIGGGVSYRRQNMLSDIREFSGMWQHERQVAALPVDAIIPRGYMAETELRRAYPYLFKVKATAMNMDTMKEEELFFSFYDDQNLSREDLGARFMRENWQNYEADYGPLTSFQVIAAQHHTGWHY